MVLYVPLKREFPINVDAAPCRVQSKEEFYMRKFLKFFTVLKLVGALALCTGCGAAVESSSGNTTTSQLDVSVPCAAAANVVDSVVDVSPETTTTAATTKEKAKTITKKTTKKKTVEYVVYKPSTHYIHRSTCSWVNDECYKIKDTNDIEALYCNDCKPDMEIVNYYEPPVETTTTTVVAAPVVEEEIETEPTTTTKFEKIETESETTYRPNEILTGSYIDDYSRQLLAEITWHEAGCSWIGIYDKARIVSGVMNRVYDDRFPNTVYDVLVQENQLSGYYPGCCAPTSECYDAVDYYFANQGQFDGCNSWYGNGKENIFYFQ